MLPVDDAALYSVENARKFRWGSISGDLHPERVAHLETYLVGQRILDAGCGGGGFVDFLQEKGFSAVGVDRHAQFLEVGREMGFRGSFVQGDITRLPFADDAFDTTFCFDVLEHVDDVAALGELARVTRTRLILAVPKEDAVMTKFVLTFSHYRDKTHLRNYTEESLEALVRGIGPAHVRIFPELFVLTRELVLEMLRPDFGALRAAVDQAIPATPPPPPPIVPDVPYPPPRNLLARVRRWLGHADALRESYRAAYEETYPPHYQSHYEAHFHALRAQCLDAAYDGAVQRFLDEAAYEQVPTGLVAVIDLEGDAIDEHAHRH